MKTLILPLIIIFFIGCTEDFPLDGLADQNRIVVEGAITNEEGPYFFKICNSSSINQSSENGEGITNAMVVISDNTGVTDTLKQLDTIIRQHPVWYYYYTTVKNYSGTIDTIRLLGKDASYLKGVYYTSKIEGVPGNRYNLKVSYNNIIVEAHEKMPEVPDIDSVNFIINYSEKDKQRFLVPQIYFREPEDQKNYYMFNFGSDDLFNILYGTSQVWNFSILNDEFLPGYIKGFNIDDGASPTGHEDFFYFEEGDSVRIRMLSLSKQAYEYYKSLIEQFENDGGAYSPTPSTPPTNLSGNALGYFRTSAVSEKKYRIKKTAKD